MRELALQRSLTDKGVDTGEAGDYSEGDIDSHEGAGHRVARARAQVPRSAVRRVPVSGWAAQSPAVDGRSRGV